jgi:SMODS-associated and fused to various effectors sensor domain
MTTQFEPLVALVGYQWGDSASAELLHEELAFRGLTVIHDRCSFAVGTRLSTAMGDAVGRCDAYVPYLTPRSLYEEAPAGAARPALDDEFLPLCRRRRASTTSGDCPPKPVIAVVTHGLGDPHTEAAERVWRATGEDVATLWSVAVNQSGEALTQTDAARVAAAVVDALLPPGGGPAGTALPIVVATRGSGQPPRFLTIDATTTLGRERRSGHPEDWQRMVAALRDVERSLSGWSAERVLDVEVKAHLAAAVAFGRVFNRAAGWHHRLAGRTGIVELVDVGADGVVDVPAETYRRGGPLIVDVDLLGHNVDALANDAVRTLPAPAGRVHAAVREEALGRDLSPAEVGVAAARVAAEVRRVAGISRPDSIHLFLAAPAAFAALLGSQLTALDCELVLYERWAGTYKPVATLPAMLG